MKKRCGFLIYLLITLAVAVKGQKTGYHAIDSMRQLMMRQTIDTERMRTFYRIGDAYARLNPNKSLQIARQGLQVCKKIHWQRGIAAFHISIGNILSDQGGYDDAIAHFDTAYRLNVKILNAKGVYSSLMNIGTAYQRRGLDNAALDYYLKALHIIDTSDGYSLALVYLNIANVYNNQENPAKALHYGFTGLKIAQQRSAQHIAPSMVAIGNGYIYLNDTATAKNYMLQALENYRLREDLVGEASVYYVLGVIEKTSEERLNYALKAKAIWDSINPNYPQALANLRNLGNEYLNRHTERERKTAGFATRFEQTAYLEKSSDLRLAAGYLQRADSLSRVTGNIDNLVEVLKSLSTLHEIEEAYRLALKDMHEYTILSDSLYSQKNKNELAEKEADYQFRQKEVGFKMQQRLSELRIRQVWTSATLLLLLAVVMFLYFINYYRLKQLRLRSALQLQAVRQNQKELRLQNELTASRLKAILAQMNPHFFFNVLNSIDSYILESKPAIASRLLHQFALLCRLILENSDQNFVSLSRIWQSLQLYTELEAERFCHAFSYVFVTPPDMELSNLLVPPMMVQPLIENAIHHGLRPSNKLDQHLRVSIERIGHTLQITVEDNGVGVDHIQPFQPHRTGTVEKSRSLGLTLIRERIAILNQQMNDCIASLEVTNRILKHEVIGAKAILILPLVSADSAEGIYSLKGFIA